MLLDDASDDGEPYAASRRLWALLITKAAKQLEDALTLRGGNADPVILHPTFDHAGGHAGTDSDDRPSLDGRVFHGIIDQVGEDLGEAAMMAPDYRQRSLNEQLGLPHGE